MDAAKKDTRKGRPYGGESHLCGGCMSAVRRQQATAPTVVRRKGHPQGASLRVWRGNKKYPPIRGIGGYHNYSLFTILSYLIKFLRQEGFYQNAQVPLRKMGTMVPSSVMPSMDISSVPIMKSTWMTESFTPISASSSLDRSAKPSTQVS